MNEGRKRSDCNKLAPTTWGASLKITLKGLRKVEYQLAHALTDACWPDFTGKLTRLKPSTVEEKLA